MRQFHLGFIFSLLDNAKASVGNSALDIMLANPSKKDNSSTKHMEVMSLSVLIALRQKNSQLCMMSILELPDS